MSAILVLLTCFVVVTGIWVGSLHITVGTFALSALLGRGFQVPLSHHPNLDEQTVAPPSYTKNPSKVTKVQFRNTRVRSADLHFPSQTFSRYTILMMLQCRFGLIDVAAAVLVPGFIWYAAEPLLGMTTWAVAYGVAMGTFCTYVWLNVVHWWQFVRPIEGVTKADSEAEAAGGNTFIPRLMAPARHHHRPGVPVWRPSSPVADPDTASPTTESSVCLPPLLPFVKKRGLAAVGMTLDPYLYDLLSWAVEYKVRAVGRMLRDLAMPKALPTHAELYEAVVNTSLACFYSAADGGLVFHDTALPWNSLGIKLWRKISLQVDPMTRTVGELVLEPYTATDEVELIATCDPVEIVGVLFPIFALKTHPLVHWFANAVADVSPKDWALSTLSHDVTQGFNNGAVFSTPEANGHATSPHWLAAMAARNLEEGLPMHKDIAPLVKHSTLHRVVTACRRSLEALEPPLPTGADEAIIQATVMHAGDHHYFARFVSHGGTSEVLNSSMQTVISCLLKPYQYSCRKLMCKQFPDDPVCSALYRAAASVDPTFADTALTVGVLV